MILTLFINKMSHKKVNSEPGPYWHCHRLDIVACSRGSMQMAKEHLLLVLYTPLKKPWSWSAQAKALSLADD